MPPKKNAPNKKTQEKAKQKVVEDKTFGLKNKKGKKQQTYIKTVNSQVQGNQKKTGTEGGTAKLSKREQDKQKLEELNALFKPVQQAQKVPAGVDPKSVLCSFFKQGLCQKGNKCKFSHDLSIERKAEKRSIYDDEREGKETMNDWDQDTLEDVINKKHGGSNKNKTDIVCKYFLEAVEKGLYGWFWNCPNSDKCIYRHALPPGYILKKDLKKEEELKDKISLDELIENERNQLSGNLTPVTYESFVAWKKRKIQEKKDNLKKNMDKKKEEMKTGKIISKISGKEVFMFKPELADAGDEEADADDLDIRKYRNMEETEEEDSGPCAEINLEDFAKAAAASANNTSKVTLVNTLLVKDRETASAPPSTTVPGELPTIDDTSHNDVNGNGKACAPQDIVIDGVPVDESLFEDLDDLDIED